MRQEQLWGGETTKAVRNFPVSGEPVPVPVIRWLGRIKGAAARVNGELALLDAELAERIAAAADRVAAGEFDDQFPIDVFQTGSGTSTNMNANEVIANLANETEPARPPQRPRQHGAVLQRRVPVGGPSRRHGRGDQRSAARARAARGLFQRKAQEFQDIVKAGRTHLMDAVPVTLGQEFSGYAAQIRLAGRRVRRRCPRSRRFRWAAPPPAPG